MASGPFPVSYCRTSPPLRGALGSVRTPISDSPFFSRSDYLLLPFPPKKLLLALPHSLIQCIAAFAPFWALDPYPLSSGGCGMPGRSFLHLSSRPPCPGERLSRDSSLEHNSFSGWTFSFLNKDCKVSVCCDMPSFSLRWIASNSYVC